MKLHLGGLVTKCEGTNVDTAQKPEMVEDAFLSPEH